MGRSETTVERALRPRGSKGQGSSMGPYKGNHDTNEICNLLLRVGTQEIFVREWFADCEAP